MVVYIHDIIIYSETWEDHVQYIERVQSKFTPINLKISLKKGNFGQQELLVLGHKVSGLSLAIDQYKVAVVMQKSVPKIIKEMQSLLVFAMSYRNHINRFSHIATSLYKECSKDIVFEITKGRGDAYERIKHELTNAPVLILPGFELPLKLYIDVACSQGLGAALHQRQIMDEGKIHTNADGLIRWPLDNVKRNPAYDPELEAKIAIHFIEIERRKDFRFSERAPGSGTPDSEDTESKGTKTPILGISPSKLHNELFGEVMKAYSKYKQCGILLQLLQQKYRSPELKSQLEEMWLRDHKDNKYLLIHGLLYHREKHTSALPVVDRDHISLILQECHDCPYMAHISEDRTKERVAITAWLPK
ncbi:hypothetical protein O181_058428 [Austropuccinia psidii MF-1]|uniref:Reverse transcriptase domain-containing protein n=1 Tax=Austropuccinia psidii MF-1 TaxID=1389203 RepID=A0A9Q3EGV9_9BASI|nr:hypothetical protein [Austropuccinia psidii MF-1]